MTGTGNLKLLIVDDERLMREGLRLFCNWQELGIGDIIDASDGSKAFELAQEARPDIVITDIRMPGMDGLTLISKLKPMLPYSVFIIISGYSDFENARKGIELGAFSYILKPIETGLFNKTMHEAVEKIRSQESEQLYIDKLLQNSERSKQYFMQTLLLSIFSEQSRLSGEDIRAQMRDMNVRFDFDYYRVVLISMLTHEGSFVNAPNGLVLLERELGMNIPEGRALLVMQGDRLAMVYGFSGQAEVAELYDSLELSINTLRSCIDVGIVTAVGKEVRSLPDLCFSYAQAKRIVEAKTFFGVEGMFPPRGKQAASRRFLPPMLEMQRLISSIELCDAEGIQGFVSRFEAEARLHATEDKEHLFSVLLELMISAARVLQARDIDVDRFLNPEIFTVAFLQTFDNADQLFRWLEQYFCMLAEQYRQGDASDEDFVTRQIKAYIIKNLHKNIRLSDIAAHFHYNSNYLGRLFKQSVGVKFSDYVQNLRVQAAKSMLLETDLSVEEVSHRVGFCDCQYFIKVFKASVGQTPKKYRIEQGDRSFEA